MVAFNIERLIVVYFPLKRFDLRKKKLHKWIMLCLILFAVLFYSYSFLSATIQDIGESKIRCSIIEDWYNLANLMAFIDAILTALIPLLLILVINILIVCKLLGKTPFKMLIMFKSKPKNEDKNEESTLLKPIKQMLVVVSENELKPCSSGIRTYTAQPELQLKINSNLNRPMVYSRTTKNLFSLSATFLILNLPIAINKIVYFVVYPSFGDYKTSSEMSTSISNNEINLSNSNTSIVFSFVNEFEIEQTSKYESLERLACYFYYLQFSLNFVLYALNGSKFRQVLKNKFIKIIRIILKWLETILF